MRLSIRLLALAALIALVGTACQEDPPPTAAPPDASTPKPADSGASRDTGAVGGEDGGQMACVSFTAYQDADGDGFALEGATSQEVCLRMGQGPPAGWALEVGDCDDGDPLKFVESEGVCGDWVDDNCDEADEVCPQTQRVDAIDDPDWDCTGTPPDNVFAWARFDDGQGYFEAGGCVYVFEGFGQMFYAKPVIARASDDPSCAELQGCTCPSLGGWPSYDRRLYAFTTDAGADPCPEIVLDDAVRPGGMRWEEQPVSNHCRKYLYMLHLNPQAYSYVSSSALALRDRLERFGQLEIACVADTPHQNLPYQQLVTADFQLHQGFRPKP